MKRTKLLTLAILAVVGLTLGASAVSYTVPATNATPTRIMILPPVYVAGAGVLQLPQRTTNATVAAGQIYRIGSQPIVAAHAGVITNGTVSTTTYVTNGLVVTTNTIVRIQDVTVPLEGLSAYDGTVRWMRTAPSRDNVRLSVDVGTAGAASVVLSDGSFNSWTYTASAVDDGFDAYPKALYVNMTGALGTGTNATVNVWPW